MSFRRLWTAAICIPVLCWGVLHSPLARAAPPARRPASRQPAEFQTYLKAALRMYERLDYERALEKLARARSHVRTPDEGSLLSLYEGCILSDLNHKEEARAAFRSGLQSRLDAKLPLRVSPKVEQDFEEVRAEVQRELARRPPKEATQGPIADRKPQQLPDTLTEVPPATPVPTPDPAVESPRPVLGTTLSGPEGTFLPTLKSRGLAYSLMGGGTAVAGTGAVLGLTALSFNERKKSMTSGEALKARATAKTQLSVGTVLLGAGIAALGTGTVLLLLPQGEPGAEPPHSRPTWALAPLPGGFALTSMGRF